MSKQNSCPPDKTLFDFQTRTCFNVFEGYASKAVDAYDEAMKHFAVGGHSDCDKCLEHVFTVYSMLIGLARIAYTMKEVLEANGVTHSGLRQAESDFMFEFEHCVSRAPFLAVTLEAFHYDVLSDDVARALQGVSVILDSVKATGKTVADATPGIHERAWVVIPEFMKHQDDEMYPHPGRHEATREAALLLLNPTVVIH